MASCDAIAYTLIVISCMVDADRVVQSLRADAQVLAISGAMTNVPDMPAAGDTLNECLKQ
jgi:uncharacterized transporter YbjL